MLTTNPSAAALDGKTSTGARVPRNVVAQMAQYLSRPILTRSQRYHVSALHQPQALIKTFYMMPNKISDATHFLGNGPHMHAASATQYLAWPVQTRSHCYDVSALYQRQALLTTFHMTPSSVSDAIAYPHSRLTPLSSQTLPTSRV